MLNQFRVNLYTIRAIVLAVFAIIQSTSVTAQEIDLVPTTGGWVITDELNGEPGRGLQLEVQNGILVLSFYGYLGTGQARWWIGAGSFTPGSNELTMELTAFQGGTSFGGAFSGAENDGSPGEVTIRFSDFDAGEICLPNESCKAIEAFNFGFVDSGSALLGEWFGSGVNEDSLDQEGWWFFFDELQSSNDPTLIDRVSGLVETPYNIHTGGQITYTIDCGKLTPSEAAATGLDYTCTSGNGLITIGIIHTRNAFIALASDFDGGILLSTVNAYRVDDLEGRAILTN